MTAFRVVEEVSMPHRLPNKSTSILRQIGNGAQHGEATPGRTWRCRSRTSGDCQFDCPNSLISSAKPLPSVIVSRPPMVR